MSKQAAFDVILADPPWTFRTWTSDSARHVSKKYNLMSTEDIAALPVRDIAAENCALFLWATWPNIEEAFPVIRAWGFTYRTIAWVWVKAKKSGTGFHFGMGYYTRANTEPCLLAVKGRMPVASHSVSAVLYAPVRRHSQKPDEQYRKIGDLYPNSRRVELFARYEREGWDRWGNEVDDTVSL